MSRRDWTNDDHLVQYLWQLGETEPDVLRELRLQTANHRMAKMALSPTQSQLLIWLLKLINAKHYLELGVFTGYSSTAAALALPEDGIVTACDINVNFAEIARSFWEKAGVTHKVTLYLQPALITLNELLDEGKNNFYDFILIDADKPTTPEYYECALKLLRTGGLIMIDNILLGGRVLEQDKNGAIAPSITIMQQFNLTLKTDCRVTPIALPMGDGTILLSKSAE